MAEVFGMAQAETTTADTEVEVYVVPSTSGIRSHLKKVRIVNRLAASVKVKLWYTPDGTTTNANAQLFDTPLLANEPYDDDGWAFLPATGTVVLQCDTANALSVTVSFVEIS